jgi:hypothetical protein
LHRRVSEYGDRVHGDDQRLSLRLPDHDRRLIEVPRARTLDVPPKAT